VEDGAFVPFVVFMEERNNRCFEDRKGTLEGIKFLFFNILYLWTTTYVFPLVINYLDFLVLFAPNS
jgi:hypothetical protein